MADQEDQPIEQVVRHLPPPSDGGGRVETGAVQFGDDWPGLFIRGDNAFILYTYWRAIEDVLLNGKQVDPAMLRHVVRSISGMLDEIPDNVVVGGWPKKKEIEP